MLGQLVAAPGDAQPFDAVRLTLVEASRAESRTCALEVDVGPTAGGAILTCHRGAPPVSQLGAHRPLTSAEAGGLFALTSGLVPRPRRDDDPARADRDHLTVTLTITRGTTRVVLDVGDQATNLSAPERQTCQALRALARELRGSDRR